MLKEFEPIQQIEQSKKNLSSVLEEANAMVTRVGTTLQNMKALVGTSIEATSEYGKYHKKTEKTRIVAPIVVEILTRRSEQFEQEVEPVINTLAQSYIERVNTTKPKMDKLRELKSQGHLTEDEIQPHEQEFDDLLRFPQSHPLFQRRIEGLVKENGDEEVRRERFQVPEGVKLGVIEKRLFDLLSDTSLENPINEIRASESIYFGEDIDLALNKFRSIRYVLGRKLNGYLEILRTKHTSTASDHLDGYDYYFKKFETKEITAQEVEPAILEVLFVSYPIHDDPNLIGLIRLRSGRYMLDNVGAIGIQIGMQTAKLLVALGGTSEKKPKTSEQLVNQVYPDKERDKALSSLNHLINDTTRTSLMGTNIEVSKVRISGDSESAGKLGYFLRRIQPSQADNKNYV